MFALQDSQQLSLHHSVPAKDLFSIHPFEHLSDIVIVLALPVELIIVTLNFA
jgi:hypothetical protein